MSSKNQVQNKLDFNLVLKSAMSTPGVRIDRNDFLRKELSKHFDEHVVSLAIEKNPAIAGIDINQIEGIANSCIQFETNKVTGLSAAAGIPGGLAMFGTVPADVIQYFAHIVRILQKLIYLYGWQEIVSSNDELDDRTMNELTLFMGIMFGVNSANATIGKLAQSAAVKAEKTLVNKALTKGAIYPVVKKVAQILGVKMNKQIFAKGVSKVIPGLGAILSGGLTYATYRPLAIKLKEYMKTLPTADVSYNREQDANISDVDFVDILETIEEDIV